MSFLKAHASAIFIKFCVIVITIRINLYICPIEKVDSSYCIIQTDINLPSYRQKSVATFIRIFYLFLTFLEYHRHAYLEGMKDLPDRLQLSTD